ncbi:hypothetical protein [Vibrio hepatarius]|uniref:hypothetical protein n=1 Tax=Vibrio hepatarius TaxID=171383 RepID=UPI001C091317|nr:hypothetical protein [Vibrio hepatarius]MBU2896001.1 hypothetical protein [Vibrio hepatarius]
MTTTSLHAEFNNLANTLANSIALSDKPIFNFKDRDGNQKQFASYNLQSRGLPDLMYIQGDSIKVG